MRLSETSIAGASSGFAATLRRSRSQVDGSDFHGEHALRAATGEDKRVEARGRAEVETGAPGRAESANVARELPFVDAEPVAGVPVEVDLHHEAATEPERQSP